MCVCVLFRPLVNHVEHLLILELAPDGHVLELPCTSMVRFRGTKDTLPPSPNSAEYVSHLKFHKEAGEVEAARYGGGGGGTLGFRVPVRSVLQSSDTY